MPLLVAMRVRVNLGDGHPGHVSGHAVRVHRVVVGVSSGVSVGRSPGQSAVVP